MSHITKVTPEDPDYNRVVDLTSKTKVFLDYKSLAEQIHNCEKGTILKINAPKQNYSNIKIGLERRKAIFNTSYTMVFSSENDEEVFYITVKG